MEAGSDTSNGTSHGNRVNQLGNEKEKANAITFLSELLPEGGAHEGLVLPCQFKQPGQSFMESLYSGEPICGKLTLKPIIT